MYVNSKVYSYCKGQSFRIYDLSNYYHTFTKIDPESKVDNLILLLTVYKRRNLFVRYIKTNNGLTMKVRLLSFQSIDSSPNNTTKQNVQMISFI